MDYKAEQEMEVEALESILMDDFRGAAMQLRAACMHSIPSCHRLLALVGSNSKDGGVYQAVHPTALASCMSCV